MKVGSYMVLTGIIWKMEQQESAIMLWITMVRISIMLLILTEE